MTINISGEFIDQSINSRFLSTPKVILYFDNGKEDRRIPMVIPMQNITYISGKCMFYGEYSYRLDYLFWKTRNLEIPCDFYFNLSFADFYEEKVKIDVKEMPKEEKIIISSDKEQLMKKLKEIRINNTLSNFNKKYLIECKEKIDNVKNFIIDPDYSNIAGLILDGNLKAASDKNIIFVFESENVEIEFNFKIKDNYNIIIKFD